MRIEDISARLSAREPKLLNLDNNRHGAVAMILRPGSTGLEVLFIERTRCEADPWSGQMAFPGGIVEAHDEDARRAAERETREEVGIDLTDALFMGRLDDVQGRHRAHLKGIVVSGFVYYDDQGQVTVPNYEVADTVWEPMTTFMNPGRFTHIEYAAAPGERFPGIRVGHAEHQVVWGLTRRFMMSFFEIAGKPFLTDGPYSQHSVQESD
jgi:8-oxo-dGTP pyrophosphatase MutT (NUDIX family)